LSVVSMAPRVLTTCEWIARQVSFLEARRELREAEVVAHDVEEIAESERSRTVKLDASYGWGVQPRRRFAIE